MTMLTKMATTCSVCSRESAHTSILSTNACGSPDLDMRPPEMLRSTISCQVQRCPHCGFCLADISENAGSGSDVIGSEEYQSQLNSVYFPVLANSFLCAAMIHRHLGRYDEAAHAAIRAAWVADDVGSKKAQNSCREIAIGDIEEAERMGQPLMEQTGGTHVIWSDLLRRTGRFAEALDVVKKGLACEPDDLVRRVLIFERKLSEASDTKRHTLDKVPKKG